MIIVETGSICGLIGALCPKNLLALDCKCFDHYQASSILRQKPPQ